MILRNEFIGKVIISCVEGHEGEEPRLFLHFKDGSTCLIKLEFGSEVKVLPPINPGLKEI